LFLTSLRVDNFRNLESAMLTPLPGLNWLFGDNGAGKTSILEAIHVLGRGRSFRANRIGPLIRDGSETLRIVAQTGNPDARLGVERSKGSWTGRINRQSCARMSDFARRLPLVLVDPENHAVVEGTPALRRSFLDWGLFHVEQGYLSGWKQYNRLLRQRNTALRTNAGGRMLEALERPMAEAAAALESLRERYVGELQGQVRNLENALSFHVEPIEVSYRPSVEGVEGYLAKWRDSRARDLEQGFTRDGPHRGELLIHAGGRPAAPRLSRGQMKLVALVLKLAQMALAHNAECEPVLLLDDPVSELDRYHLDSLLGWLGRQPNQTWITAVEKPAAAAAAVFHVEQGKIHAVL